MLYFNGHWRGIDGVLVMVKNVTSLTGNGLRDWLILRVSFVIILIYTVFLVGFILLHAPLQYENWCALFHNNWMRISTLIVLIATFLYMYISMWTIFTDYLKNTFVRLVAEIITFICLIAFFIWGIVILWSV